ncbi:hypothetical protein AGMMS50256_38040 [Betaproteobacteria bacterium]|nr:hypothetical protein AGMMS50256_38040 [Betaproteobacteria bacterium]
MRPREPNRPISPSPVTLREVYVRNEVTPDGKVKTYNFPGAWEQREPGDTPDAEKEGGLRAGDLIAQGDTNVHTLINDLSGTKKVGPYTGSEYLNGTGSSTIADQDIDGATDAQNNGYAFTDVRIFDASITKADDHINKHGRIDDTWKQDFQGNIRINAILTENVVNKYLNLKDQAPDIAARDDLDFVYDLGANNDVLDLAISSANLLKAGTTTFADFNLKIYGEAGNDLISTAIYNAEYLDELANADDSTPWYINSKQNANLYINAGEGDDVVNTFGSGDWKIDLGNGNDTYYADNTGHMRMTSGEEAAGSTGRATWIFNAVDTNLESLTSDVNDLHWLYKTKVQVSFTDVRSGTYVSKDIVIPTAPNTYRTSDHDVNRAIIAAINDDPVLSKLLVAEESVGSTLVVRALSDGEHAVVGDLEIDFVPVLPTELNSQDVSGLKRAYVDYLINHDGFDSQMANLVVSLITTTTDLAGWINGSLTNSAALTKLANDYASVFAIADGNDIKGYDSEHVSDNVIDAGKSYHAGTFATGTDGYDYAHDVIVLGTGALSNDTIKFTGLDNGYTTVVNFVETPVTPAVAATRGTVEIDLDGLVTAAGTGTDSDQIVITLDNGAVFTSAAGLFATTADVVTAFAGVASTTTTGWTASVSGTVVTLTRTAAGDIPALEEVTSGTITIAGGTASGTLVIGGATVAEATVDFTDGTDVVPSNSGGTDYLDFSNANPDGLGVFAAFLTSNTYAITDKVALDLAAGAGTTTTNTVNEGAYYVTVAADTAGEGIGTYRIELWQDTDKDGVAEFNSTAGGPNDTRIGLIGYVDFGEGHSLTAAYWDAATVHLV